MTILISREPLLFIFERLDISRASHLHPSQKLWSFEFAASFRCSISSVSTYYEPQSYIHLKCYDHLNFSKASVVLFRASQYIMGLTHTAESKVMAVRICRELPFSISSVSTYYAPQSEIRLKCFDHLNYSKASIVLFLASRYVIRFTHTPESKFLAV